MTPYKKKKRNRKILSADHFIQQLAFDNERFSYAGREISETDNDVVRNQVEAAPRKDYSLIMGGILTLLFLMYVCSLSNFLLW